MHGRNLRDQHQLAAVRYDLWSLNSANGYPTDPPTEKAMTWFGNGEGNTFLILTDAESRMVRRALVDNASVEQSREGREAYSRGVARGTAKLAKEFAERKKR